MTRVTGGFQRRMACSILVVSVTSFIIASFAQGAAPGPGNTTALRSGDQPHSAPVTPQTSEGRQETLQSAVNESVTANTNSNTENAVAGQGNELQQLLQETYREVPVEVEDLSISVTADTSEKKTDQREKPKEEKPGGDASGNERNDLADESEEYSYESDSDGDSDSDSDSDSESAAWSDEDDDEDEDDEEEEEEENSDDMDYLFAGVSYDLPIQLRPREGGADPGYLQMIMTERAVSVLLSTNPNASPEETSLVTKQKEKKPQSNGVYVMCFVKDEKELPARFEKAMELGEGVYVPLQKMTDFARHKDYTIGNPGVQEVQLSPAHYAQAKTEWNRLYFDTIKDLKEKTKMKIAGMWLGPPDYEQIDRLMKQNKKLFDGVYLNWEDGEKACMNNFGRPPQTNAAGAKTYWASNPGFFFRYYMGGQDGDVCTIADGRSYIRDAPVNAGRELTLPDGVTPVFPCYGGNEGTCYKAFSRFIETACDPTLQRYSFAIYDRHSDRMRLMLEEGCKNINLPVPEMDFVGAV